MSVEFPVSMDETQWHQMLTAVKTLGEHDPYWAKFVTLFTPPFLGFILGLASASYLDWRKTLREDNRVARERQEKEFGQLNVAIVGLAFNVEALIHIVIQNILPHREQSHKAYAAIEAINKDDQSITMFALTISENYPAMTMTCPEPYLVELRFLQDMPFIVAKDAELVKKSGWIISHARALNNALSERNKRIAIVNRAAAQGGLNFYQIRSEIQGQASIGNAEAVSAFQLLEAILAARETLTKLAQEYTVSTRSLKVDFPAALGEVMRELGRIRDDIVPTLPTAAAIVVG